MRNRIFFLMVVATLLATMPNKATSSEQNNSINLNLGGSLTVSLRKEGEISALVLFVGPGEEVKINGEQLEAKCLVMNNEKEIDIRVQQQRNVQNILRDPPFTHNGGRSVNVVAQVEAKNCREVQNQGHNRSGIYTLSPYMDCPERLVDVLCDLDLDGGGWTVIQNRDLYGPQGNFFRASREYNSGFGNLSSNFWLGVKHVHALTNQSHYEARFDMTDFEDRRRLAKYGKFAIGSDNSVVLEENSGQQSAAENCAIMWESPWWFQHCYVEHENSGAEDAKNNNWLDVMWEYWRGERLAPKASTIRIRPKV